MEGVKITSYIYERYRDWYCEDLLEGYLNGEIDIDELILKLDYNKVIEQRDLFFSLNLILSNKYPHNCYNKNCRKKLFFSNTFNQAQKTFSLKQLARLWVGPYNLKKNKKKMNVRIPFFCCNCFKNFSSKEIQK